MIVRERGIVVNHDVKFVNMLKRCVGLMKAVESSILILLLTAIRKECMIYLISCAKGGKKCVGSTITSFIKRFNNHKSSMNRYGNRQRGIAGGDLYTHFFKEGHRGIL